MLYIYVFLSMNLRVILDVDKGDRDTRNQLKSVYAGDPSKINMKAAFGKVWNLEQTGGSIIGGTFKTIQERSVFQHPKGQTVESFREGLAMLPDAIATSSGNVYKTESELVEAVDCDLRKMLINPNATDPLVSGVRVWPQAIPQFLSGHFDIPDAARDASEVTDYK
uniref:Amine oxidase domain-containing protein n=1 Tax=Salix viminalis TaxID=40686 RepID=A0A6N2MZK8_SALVM